MAAYLEFPFLHSALLTVGMVAIVIAQRFLPDGWPWGWRWVAGLIVGGAAVLLAGLAGLAPWVGVLHLSAYAVLMLVAFVAAWALIRPRMPSLGLTAADLPPLMALALVLGVVGARARYVWERWDALVALHGERIWSVVLDFDRGGAVWYGGLVLATCGIAVALWRRGVPLVPAADVILPGVFAGLAIGRIGCFLNGCCYGGPCDLPWAVDHPPHGAIHPTQLYEAVVMGLWSMALWWVWRRRPWDGFIAAGCLVGYGAWRFFNETLRGDHDAFVTWPLLGRITTSQGTSVLLMAVGLGLAVWGAWRRKRAS